MMFDHYGLRKPEFSVVLAHLLPVTEANNMSPPPLGLGAPAAICRLPFGWFDRRGIYRDLAHCTFSFPLRL